MLRKHLLKLVLTASLFSLVLFGTLLKGGVFQAHASSGQTLSASNSEHLTYYGANLQTMQLATGVHLDGTLAANGPWPQYASNYCFVAVVQAITNYEDISEGKPMRYPSASDEGPLSGNPDDEQPGQILYDMDHLMIPADGPLTTVSSGVDRRPFTLANIAYDFGGDPRSQAFGTDFEAPSTTKYHEYIYHTTPAEATLSMAKSLALYHMPVIALVNHAEHSVIVAGFWATGNPLIDPHAQITSLAVFNPWDISWGTLLSSTNYAQVSYDDWINNTTLSAPWGGTNSWENLPYSSNGILDPDPSIGMYQAGAGTQNPDAHYWIGNFVVIQPDHHQVSANYSFDENNHLMLHP